MRVLFVYPNLYTQMGFNHGLASLSAVLEEAGHGTRLLNLNENLPPVPTDEQVFEAVREWGPGLIGFSCLTQQYREGLRLARFLRRRAAEEGLVLPPLVVGGIHPTMVPKEVMADGVWDHVGVGECEDALLALVAATERGEVPDDLPNFLSWRGGRRPAVEQGAAVHAEQWVENPVGEFPDLERLPMPNYELFDTGRITAQKQGWFGLLTSRGCPYRCTYCLNHKLIDRYRADLRRPVPKLNFFRFRRPEQMIAEIRWVLERYPHIGTFILDDDLFTQNPEHALAFCAAYEAAEIEVPFVVNSHVKQLDPRVAEALARAGCKILKLGIEAGAVRVRKEVLKRNMSDADILETVRSAESFGLHTSGFVMTGLPGETREERWATVELLARSRIGRFRTSLFFPFPGTESHRLSIEGGYVDPAKAGSLTDFTTSSALDFGGEENLFVAKLAAAMPWFVNSRLDLAGEEATAARYRPLVEEVLALDAAEWERFQPRLRAVDAEYSRAAAAAAELHYAIRYNAFMGVRSDFYLAEEQGLEWATAAAKPVPERLRELALAAAANEVC
jgi:anaerobic magnesium-protoporphyrin IX monomethyl ester cyclase